MGDSLRKKSANQTLLLTSHSTFGWKVSDAVVLFVTKWFGFTFRSKSKLDSQTCQQKLETKYILTVETNLPLHALVQTPTWYCKQKGV